MDAGIAYGHASCTDSWLGVRDQAREQVGVVRQDHRVAVAVGHEHRHVDGAQPLQSRVIGIPQVQTAEYCASRVAHVVAVSGSSVRA